MKRIKEKKERSLGTRLFIKAERCSSPKCVMIRRPYRPGVHGQSRRRRSISEFGRQLQEKQKIQITYGLNNRQMRNLFQGPLEKALVILEKRLDRVTYLLGLAASPRVARQIISHGHITVNGRKVTIPSYSVKIGDVISIRTESRGGKMFEELGMKLKQYEPPSWLKLDKENLKGECIENPKLGEINASFNLNLVGQFYAR
ncbi:MAG: 30S ribosomal protein S4 [Candidatus Jorgensenbacteria bacterium]